MFSANIIHANIARGGDKRGRKIYMKSPQPDAFMVLNILDAVGFQGLTLERKKMIKVKPP